MLTPDELEHQRVGNTIVAEVAPEPGEVVVAKRGASKGPLEELFAMMGGHRPAKRKLTPSEFPEEEWITRQVTIHVQAAEPVSAPLAK